MSLHNENGISPDSGVRGPLNRQEEPNDLAPDEDVPDETIVTDPGSDVDPQEGHVR